MAGLLQRVKNIKEGLKALVKRFSPPTARPSTPSTGASIDSNLPLFLQLDELWQNDNPYAAGLRFLKGGNRSHEEKKPQYEQPNKLSGIELEEGREDGEDVASPAHLR